jgi:hypothetical protein
MVDQHRVEHLVFESFDGTTLRLAVEESAADMARFIAGQVEQIRDLVKRATGRGVSIVIDASRVAPRPGPSVQAAGQTPEIVRKAAELFDATLVSVDRA